MVNHNLLQRVFTDNSSVLLLQCFTSKKASECCKNDLSTPILSNTIELTNFLVIGRVLVAEIVILV